MGALRRYYWLIKPGIVFGNVIAAIAGFFLASAHANQLDLWLFLAVVWGTAFVIASACVLNNYIDRDLDRKMKRTSWRATAAGQISTRAVITYTLILGLIGFGTLAVFTNGLVLGLEAVAYFSYIVLYGIAKRRTIHSTLVGTIPGAIPPVAGYVAVTGRFDLASLLLFLVLVAWQMPHFYAIGMRRRDEYAKAGLPVMPVAKGMHATKVQILFYIAAFIIINILLVAYGYVGYAYLLVMVSLGVIWFIKGVRGFKTDDDQKWAKRMFLFSLVTLLSLSAMLAIGALLP